MNRFWFWVLHHVPDFANFDKFSDEITYCPICGRSRDSARPKTHFYFGRTSLFIRQVQIHMLLFVLLAKEETM